MKKIFDIDIDKTARVTYRNNATKTYWNGWKHVNECSEDELKQVNLATPHPKYILLDKDFHNSENINIDKEYQKLKIKLINNGIKNWLADRSRNGFHIFIPTTNLASLINTDIQKEVRNIFIKEYECDEIKKSAFTVISLPNRVHFKTGNICGIIEEVKGEVYTIKDSVIRNATEKANQKAEILLSMQEDSDFTNYFSEDAFFKYISNNVIPDGTNRDHVVFPNLAVACAKSGKTVEEIKTIIIPIIKKNFPGKTWNEFYGWLKKAIGGTVTDYNYYQINNWMKLFGNNGDANLYDMVVKIKDDTKNFTDEDEEKGFKFYWYEELNQLENQKTEWLIDKWLPQGDICFVAGKASSFKSTICLHMAHAVAEGMPVFNKYNTKKTRVLYLNEENSPNIMSSMIRRVVKGFQLEPKNKNICYSMLENIKLDNAQHLMNLIDFINENKIGLLVCDSFRRFITFDENNATEMNSLFNKLKILRKSCNQLTIMIIHHQKKTNDKGFMGDVRDSLRGSSDIVNSADSIIGIGRKTGSTFVRIGHIKNRSGIEMENRLLNFDAGDKNDRVYIYESEKTIEKNGNFSAPSMCAEKIWKWIEENSINKFKWSEIPKEINDKYSSATINKAIKEMVEDGTLTSTGNTKSKFYFPMKIKEKNKKEVKVKDGQTKINI